jgi:hypothetical protein
MHVMSADSPGRKFARFLGLAIVLLVAAYLRVGAVNDTDYGSQIRSDAFEYYKYAINLRYNQTYSLQRPPSKTDPHFDAEPDAMRPPGYALFLLPFSTYPPPLDIAYAIQIAQVLLDLLTVLLVFLIARTALGYRSSLVAAGFTALSSHLIIMNVYLLTETVFTFSLILYLYIATLAANKPKLWLWLLCGLVLGISCLIKPTMNYFLPFALASLPLLVPRERLLKCTLVITLGFAVVMTPWALRNAMLDDAASPRSLSHLQNGSYPDLMHNGDPESRAIPHRKDPNYGNIQTLGQFLDDLWRKVSAEPSRYLKWYLVDKLQVYYQWDIIAGLGDIYIYPVYASPFLDDSEFRLSRALMKGAHPLLMIASLAFCVAMLLPAARRRLNREQVLLAVIGATVVWYFTLVHWVGNPLPRYAIPIRPIQYILAVFAIFLVYKAAVYERHNRDTST